MLKFPVGKRALATAVVAGSLLLPTPAHAADTRPCVTVGEYRAISKGMPQPRLFRVLDGRGTVIGRLDHSYPSETGVVRVIDVLRAYRKCPSFGRPGRIGVWLDTYSMNTPTMHVWTKRPNRPAELWWWL